MSSSPFSSALVICTRNRPEDMESCLKSLVNQTDFPMLTLVVDSSDGDTTQIIVEKLTELNPKLSIKYMRTASGLTFQRNIALSTISQDYEVVHFIDDDVELEPTYLAMLNREFEKNTDLVGAGGMVLGGVRKPPRLSAILGMRDSRRPGAVLPSGYNIGAHETPTICQMDWLPGCSMSFRTIAIKGLKFDEARTGYALGEDVDFGLKASGRGLLLHIPTARLLHKLSPTNRHDRPEMTRMAVSHRWQLAKDFPFKVRKPFVIYASVANIASSFYKALRWRDSIWLKCAVSESTGLMSCILKREPK